MAEDDKDGETAMVVDTDHAFGDTGVEAKEKSIADDDGSGRDGGGTSASDVKVEEMRVEEQQQEEDDEKLDVKVEDLDDVLKELMLYADMSSRDCQPFLTRHAYVHR